MHAARAQPGEMSLADQQPGRCRLLLLRERASQRTALLPGTRADRLSVSRSATQQRGCVNIRPQPRCERRDVVKFLLTEERTVSPAGLKGSFQKASGTVSACLSLILAKSLPG